MSAARSSRADPVVDEVATADDVCADIAAAAAEAASTDAARAHEDTADEVAVLELIGAEGVTHDVADPAALARQVIAESLGWAC